MLPDLVLCTDPPALCGLLGRVLSTLKGVVVPLFVYAGTALHTAVRFPAEQWRWQTAFMRYHLGLEGERTARGQEQESSSPAHHGQLVATDRGAYEGREFGFGAVPVFWALQSHFLAQMYAEQTKFRNPVFWDGNRLA